MMVPSNGGRMDVGLIMGMASTLLSFLALFFLAGPVSAASEDRISVDIGVLAYRGTERALRNWAPTAEYLSTAIPGFAFRITPLSLDALRRATREGTVDFVLTNTGHYVDLESRFGISRITTLKRSSGVGTRNMFGAVIFTRADRTDIQGLKHLRGKSFVAVASGAFGGFQMAWREMKARGLDPFSDLSRLTFLGFPQDRMVYAVRDGEADAGTVRTGVLETMAAEGHIDGAAFRVLNRRSVPGYRFMLSTRLYPEWPFAKLRQTPEDLAERVAVALLNMAEDDPAATAGDYSGWTVPLDYQPVHDMFRELRIGPYGRQPVGLRAFVQRYWAGVAATAVILVVIVVYGVRTGNRAARSRRQLSRINTELERQIAERRRAETTARRRETELARGARGKTPGDAAAGAELDGLLGRLTPRQRQVLDLIVAGHPNKRVAHRLGISEKTVEAHRAQVMAKMEARSFADLVQKVIKTGPGRELETT